MTEMILIAVGMFAVVATLYGVYGVLSAGANWKHWLLEQALPLYGVMAVALAALIFIIATIIGGRAI